MYLQGVATFLTQSLVRLNRVLYTDVSRLSGFVQWFANSNLHSKPKRKLDPQILRPSDTQARRALSALTQA